MENVNVNRGADVNCDGKIGIHELVYALQTVAGIRVEATI